MARYVLYSLRISFLHANTVRQSVCSQISFLFVLLYNKLYTCTKRDCFYRFRKNIKKEKRLQTSGQGKSVLSILILNLLILFLVSSHSSPLLFNIIQAALIILFQKHPIKKKNRLIFVSDLTYFLDNLTETLGLMQTAAELFLDTRENKLLIVG